MSGNRNKLLDNKEMVSHGSAASRFLGSLSSAFPVPALLFAALACVLLPIKNATMLKWYDEMSFFSADMFGALSMHPGGVIDYAGAYLTQYLFYPWVGAAILVVLWLAMAWCVSRAFGLQGRLPWAFLPSICLLVSVATFDEAWISLRSHGSVFTPSLGFLFVSAVALLRRAFAPRRWARCLLPVVAALLYPFAGFYALLSCAVCLSADAVDACRRRKAADLVPLLAGVAVAAAVPIAYYYLWNGTVADADNLYLKGLPGFRIDSYDMYMWMPLAVASALMAAYAAMGEAGSFSGKGFKTAGVLLFVAFGVYAVVASGRVSDRLRDSVTMLRYIDHNQWEHVGEMMESGDVVPDIYMAVYYNLSRQKLGMPMVEVEVMPEDGATDNPRLSRDVLGPVFLSIPANYHLGKANDSYRWAMENMVFNRVSVYYLKYMVRTALCNGEPELARKYNDKILGTLFHSYWAEHYKKYIDNPELMKESAEFNSIPEYAPDHVFIQPDK